MITTKPLLEKIPLKIPGKAILLEEIAAAPRLGERVAALLLWFLPGAWIERNLSRGKRKGIDDLATVIFSSGSTGDPKGVMLTHYNIASNIEQMLRRSCSMVTTACWACCRFHSFGFTVTLWLPAVLGVSVVYHPSPLDLTAVGEW